MTLALLLVAVGVLMILNSIAVRLRELVGAVRRMAPGCTCPMHGLAPSSTCPAHKSYVPGDKVHAPTERAPAPPPDSTDAFYTPPGRNE